MAVCAITNFDAEYIWHRYPFALGLQDYAQWWRNYDNARQLHTGLVKFPRIFVLAGGVNPGEDYIV